MTSDEILAYLNTIALSRVQMHVARMRIPVEFSKLQLLADHSIMAILRKITDDTVTFDFIQEAVLHGHKRD